MRLPTNMDHSLSDWHNVWGITNAMMNPMPDILGWYRQVAVVAEQHRWIVFGQMVEG